MRALRIKPQRGGGEPIQDRSEICPVEHANAGEIDGQGITENAVHPGTEDVVEQTLGKLAVLQLGNALTIPKNVSHQDSPARYRVFDITRYVGVGSRRRCPLQDGGFEIGDEALVLDGQNLAAQLEKNFKP